VPDLHGKTGVITDIKVYEDGDVYIVEMDETFLIDRPHYYNDKGEFQHSYGYQPDMSRAVEEKQWYFCSMVNELIKIGENEDNNPHQSARHQSKSQEQN